jgi:hypothetical protein
MSINLIENWGGFTRTSAVHECEVMSAKCLSDYMKRHPELFAEPLEAHAITARANRGALPAVQHKLFDIHGKLKAGRGGGTEILLYNVSEVLRWLELGADAAACVQVLKEREVQS